MPGSFCKAFLIYSLNIRHASAVDRRNCIFQQKFIDAYDTYTHPIYLSVSGMHDMSFL